MTDAVLTPHHAELAPDVGARVVARRPVVSILAGRVYTGLLDELRLLRPVPPGGAFHGEEPRNDGYLAQLRSTWGKP